MSFDKEALNRLREKLAKLRRIALGCYPTPLLEAKALSKALGGPRILIKRDDLSGLALGGNKCRQIEFLMGYAKEQGYDVIIYGRGHQKATQSNYAVQLISAAGKAGVEVRIYTRGVPGGSSPATGNDLLQNLIAPEVSWIDVENQERFIAKVTEEARKLREAGRRPLVMPTLYKNQTPIEQAGWVNAAAEICEQLQDMGTKADYVLMATSQGGTQAGMAVGTKYLGTPFNIVGISVMYPKERQISEIIRMGNETAQFLNLDVRLGGEEIIVHDDYMGGNYETISNECVEAIRLVARTEGIFLDPVYTGKAMAGLIDLIRKGTLTAKDTVVFIHTGGTPALFLHGKELTAE